MAEAQIAAYAQIARTAALEAVGMFWLAAELAILFFIIAARRHILARPLPRTFAFNNAEKRRAALWACCFAALAAAVFARHVFHAAAPVPPDPVPLIAHRARVHMAVWCAFVTGWVALEIAIVYNGYRGYAALKTLLAPPAPAAKHAAGKIAMLFFLAPLLLHSAAHAQALLHAAGRQNQIYYNAMYLYLRLAGLLWIAAEWAAAAILWRAHLLMKNAVRKATPND